MDRNASWFFVCYFSPCSLTEIRTPIAVGRTVTSLVKARQENMKGKVLTIMHIYTDYLWCALGPSPSLITKLILARQMGSKKTPPETPHVPETTTTEENTDEIKENTKEIEKPNSEEKSDAAEEKAYEEGSEETTSTVTPEEMDALFLKSALQAMKRYLLLQNPILILFRVVKDKQLPMPVNVFFAHIINSRPKGTTLNIKHSSHKKASVLLAGLT